MTAVYPSDLLFKKKNDNEKDSPTKILSSNSSTSSTFDENYATVEWFQELSSQKPLVLIGFRGHFCEQGRAYIEEFDKIVSDFQSAGYEVYGITTQSKENARRCNKGRKRKVELAGR